MSSNKIVCYYNAENTLAQTIALQSLISSSTKTLFSDKELTKQIGYTSYIGNIIPWDFSNYLNDCTCLFFIGDKIIKCTYIKKNNETIKTPIMYYNNATNYQFLGTVTREVLEGSKLRKVTIELSE